MDLIAHSYQKNVQAIRTPKLNHCNSILDSNKFGHSFEANSKSNNKIGFRLKDDVDFRLKSANFQLKIMYFQSFFLLQLTYLWLQYQNLSVFFFWNNDPYLTPITMMTISICSTSHLMDCYINFEIWHRSWSFIYICRTAVFTYV